MKNFLTKTTALTIGIMFSILGPISETMAWINPWSREPKAEIRWNEQDLADFIQDLIKWVLGFLAIIAVIIFIIAWFMIMTAWGDEDKVKKGKTWMINAIIWIVVIFLSWSVVKWVFDVVMWTAVT